MLTELLKYALFDGPEPDIPEGFDWDNLLKESQREAVTALVNEALVKLPASKRPAPQKLFHFVTFSQTLEQDHRRYGAATAHLQQVFAQAHPECGERPLPVVKGLRLASLYPTPTFREFGDVDLFSSKHTEKLIQFVESLGVEVDNDDSRHATFVFDEVPFEAHRYLFYTAQDNAAFDNLRQEQGLSLELHAAFIAAHIERHAVFFNEPVKVKSLVDWVYLRRQLDIPRYEAIKRSFSTWRFADLLTHYSARRLGLPEPVTAHYTPSDAAMRAFPAMFCDTRERSEWAIVRVFRRSRKYIKYGSIYKELYGQSMFRRFYFHNVVHALSQMLHGEERKVRR